MIDDFPIPFPVAGLNKRDDQFILGKAAPGMLVDISNLDYYEGGLKTRDGYTAYNATALATGIAVMNLYAYNKKDGTKILLAVCGTDIYKEGATPGSFSSIKSGITADNLWDFVTMANMCIGVDGTSGITLKYDGATAYALVVTKPQTAPSVSLSGTGLTGTYSYCVSFVTKWGAETNVGTGSTPVSPSNQQVTLSQIPIGGADVAERKIYRTKTGGSVYYYLKTLTDNIATETTDILADTGLGTDIAPVDHDPPPSDFGMLAEWKHFLWGVRISEPARIYFSHQGYPEIFNTDEVLGYYVEVGLDDGEHIIGMHKLQQTFYVFKEDSTWPITGDTPDDFKVAPEPINGAIGLYHRSVAKMPDGRFAGLHRSGVYLFDGYRYESLTDRPQDSIQLVIDGLNPNRLKYAKGYVDKQGKRYLLSVSESGYSYNNLMLIYDYLRDKWTIFDIKGNDFVKWNDTILFASSQTDGKIYKMGGTNDNGVAISVKAEWPWWSLWDSEVLKTIRFMLVDTTQTGSDYEPTLTAYVDGRSIAIPIYREDRALWGSGKWVLEGGQYRIRKILRIDRKGIYSMKVKLSHSGLNEPITLAGMTIYGYVSDRLAVR